MIRWRWPCAIWWSFHHFHPSLSPFHHIYIRPKVVTFSTARSGFNRTGTGAWTAWTVDFAASRLGARLEGTTSWRSVHTSKSPTCQRVWVIIRFISLRVDSFIQQNTQKKTFLWKKFHMNCSHLERFFGGNAVFGRLQDWFFRHLSFLHQFPVACQCYIICIPPIHPKGVLMSPKWLKLLFFWTFYTNGYPKNEAYPRKDHQRRQF